MTRSPHIRPIGMLLAAGAVAFSLTVAGPAQAVTFTPGAAGIGDPYFPHLGNGGFDVGHYDLALAYRPSTHYLAGTVTISATATQNLSRFDLDLSGMAVHAVTVDGADATFARVGAELRITPPHGITDGSAFSTAVTYDGSPKTITDSPIVFGSDYGWQYTPDGAFVGDEPNAAHTWFPSSDHPSDKASFTFRITVPDTRSVIANGELASSTTAHAKSTYVWDETKPMATYLATLGIGRWKYRHGTTAGGIPETMAYAPVLADEVKQRDVFGVTGRVTDFWSKEFGPYPFTSTGAIVDSVPDVGFSLETQTRPLYGFAPDPGTISHELAHQWFGDDVSVATWRDIWLNEGFATFASWLWDEHTSGVSTLRTAQSVYREVGAHSSFWDQSVADPQRNGMFSSAVYYRGGMTLAALRHLIGDSDFFTLLRTWTTQHRYGNGSTAQFESLAEQVSGQDLSTFFRIWLVDKVKPASFTAH